MTQPMPHWPDLSGLTIDCLFCAVNACEGSLHAEDQAFAFACQQEMTSRLRQANEQLDSVMIDWRAKT